VNPNLGEVWESDATLVQVRLTNTTDKPLSLTRIGGNCNCTRAYSETATIAPHGELVVNLTYDLTKRHPMDFGKLSCEFEVEMSVEISGSPSKRFVLKGTCRSHIAMSTTVLHFGESNVRGSPPISRWLDVAADAETANLRIVPIGSAVQVGAVERHGNGWRVQLTPNVPQVHGQFDSTLQVFAVNSAGEVIANCQVVVDGIVRELVELLWEGPHAP
jgi:hypothetical protein